MSSNSLLKRLFFVIITITVFSLTSCVSLTFTLGKLLEANGEKGSVASYVRDEFMNSIEKETPESRLVYSHYYKFVEENGEGVEISATSFDGAILSGTFYEKENSNKYYLGAHGLFSNGDNTMCLGSYFFENGYNVISVDLRGHGNSGGEFIGLGKTDSKDFAAWINWIIERDPEAKIVVMGKSISAIALMIASGNGFPPNVKCLIEDSGFPNLRSAAETLMRDGISVPYFPLLNMVDFATGSNLGFELEEVDVKESLSNNTVPFLFITGDLDPLVPLNEFSKLAGYLPESCYRESLIVKGANHGQSIFVDTENYLSVIFGFCNKFIN